MATEATLQARIEGLEAALASATAIEQINRDLNTAHDEDELLQVIARPAIEAGAVEANLLYIDLDEASAPEWAEVVAPWRRAGEPRTLAGTRVYLPEFPFSRLWMAGLDEPQLIADAVTDGRVDENARNLMAQAGDHALAVIPLAQAGRWVGLATFTWDEPHEFDEQEAAIYRALVDLASRVVENRRLLVRTQKTLKEAAFFKAMVENSVDAITMGDLERKFTYANRASHELYGYDYEKREMVGQLIFIIWPDGSESFLREEIFPQAMKGGWFGEPKLRRRDGSLFDASMAVFVVRDEAENPVGTVAFARDITERKQAEAKHERLQQEIIEAQKRAIQELSTPIIPVMEGIIVMPLIGSVDTMRARDLMRALLAGISEYRANVVIIDITGVPILDSGVADHLNKTIQAARLKGAETIITGVSDAVAETIIDLGIDWSEINTLGNLQTGLQVALKSLGITLSYRK